MSKTERKPLRTPADTPIVGVSEPVKLRNVPTHKRCPCCWGGLHGEGHKYSHHKKGSMTRFYLRCDMCGHTWTADIVEEVIAVDHRLPESISTR